MRVICAALPTEKRWRPSSEYARVSGSRVQITEDVPPPEAGTADAALPLYKPDQLVRYMLEINAGVARDLGIQVGDIVTFVPDIDAGRAQ